MAPTRINPCITHLIMNIFVVPLNPEDILVVYADVFQIIIPRHNLFLSKNLFIETTVLRVFQLTSITPHNDCQIREMIACRKKNTELRA